MLYRKHFQDGSVEPQIPRLRSPDFLWELVALSHFMRLSLTERRTRGLLQRSVAGNPGRDDKGEGGALREGWLVAGRDRQPSTSLRFGRDDTSVVLGTKGQGVLTFGREAGSGWLVRTRREARESSGFPGCRRAFAQVRRAPTRSLRNWCARHPATWNKGSLRAGSSRASARPPMAGSPAILQALFEQGAESGREHLRQMAHPGANFIVPGGPISSVRHPKRSVQARHSGESGCSGNG